MESNYFCITCLAQYSWLFNLSHYSWIFSYLFTCYKSVKSSSRLPSLLMHNNLPFSTLFSVEQYVAYENRMKYIFLMRIMPLVSFIFMHNYSYVSCTKKGMKNVWNLTRLSYKYKEKEWNHYPERIKGILYSSLLKRIF